MMKFTSNTIDLIKAPLRKLRNVGQSFWYSGKGRFCPVCRKHSRKFLSAGTDAETERLDARCPHCGSVERHRLLLTYLDQSKLLASEKYRSMLHIAPEPFLISFFRKRFGSGYLNADLFDEKCMVKMDITCIQYPDESFDFIYCSHVLEHIPDDRKAMKELCRVMSPKGLAILLVPITAEKTYEDSSVTDPEERLLKFGQRDHVRRYGADYIDRLRESGFIVECRKINDIVDAKNALDMRITSIAGDLFLCRKS